MQINYWLGYKDFLKIAGIALKNDCIILEDKNNEICIGDTIDFISEDNKQYYFAPKFNQFDNNPNLSLLSYAGVVIQAGFSYIDESNKKMSRSRIYVGSGYYDDHGDYISRSDEITKIYNKLVRIAKKVAPYTELTDIIDGEEWKHKEYVSVECLNLRKNNGYNMRAN